MKTVAAVVAVFSLLITPVALADGTQEKSPPEASTAKVATPDSLAAPKGSFGGSYSRNPHDGPWSPVRGSFQGTYSTHPSGGSAGPVETSFETTNDSAS